MPFVRGDEALLVALFTYRYLRSGQLARLTERSVQVVRRRMRALVELGYVVALERLPMAEIVYALGPKGWEQMAKELETSPAKLPYSRVNAKSAETIFMQHTLLTNDVRIAFDLALRDHPHVALRRAIPEWELANPEARKPAEKYVLAEDLKYKDGHKKKTVRFRPDCLFILYPKKQGPKYSAALFLESDRSTESVAGKIHEKYTAYRLYFQQGRYWDSWQAGKMRVLFAISGGNPVKRIAKMREDLLAMADELDDPTPVEGQNGNAAFVYCFRFCDASQLTSETVVDHPIWSDWQGNPVALFSLPKGPTVKEADHE
jgi:hypothetical protein